MIGPKARGFAENLADFLSSTEGMSDEELDAALEADDVDIKGLLADVKAIAVEGERRRKEAWARRMIAQGDAVVARVAKSSVYGKMGRPHLLAEVSRHAQAGAQAFFHGYKTASDDDLRAMLEEFEAVGGVPRKEK